MDQQTEIPSMALPIEFEKSDCGPGGFSHAVKQGGEVVGWFRNEDHCEQFAWSLCFLEMLEEVKNRAFLNQLCEYLVRLRKGA